MTPEQAKETKRRLFNVIDSHIAVVDPSTKKRVNLLPPDVEWEIEDKLAMFDGQIRGVGFGPNLAKMEEAR